jgi:hypothetical protein
MTTDAEYQVGHTIELHQVASELRPTVPGAQPQTPPALLVNVCGPSRSGRKTFLARLWKELSPGEVPRVFFTLAPTQDGSLTRQLLDSAKANRSYLEDALKKIAASLDAQAKRLEEAGRPLPEEALLTLWSELVVQNLMEDPSCNRGLQLIVALPNLMDFDPTRRSAIAREMPRAGTGTDSRILVTTLPGTPAELLTGLFPERGTPLEVTLPPLDIGEVEDWLTHRGLPVELTAEVYAASGGYAGKLEAAAVTVARERQERILISTAEKALEGLAVNERRLVCLAALLPEVDAFSVKALMEDADAALVMAILARANWSGCEWKGKSFVLSPAMRQALNRFFETHIAADYRKALPLAEQFAQIQATIPASQDRETLARLCLFNYFNESLLKTVAPDLAAEAMRLARSGPYCESSGSNFRLKAEVRQMVENYMKLVRMSAPQEDRARITAAWEERRRAIMDGIAKSEVKIKKDEGSLDTIRTQIRQMSGPIDKELDRIESIRRKARRQSQRQEKNAGSAPAQGLLIGRWAMQVLGVVIIYVSILLSSKSSIVYVGLGIALIVGGLFVKGGLLTTSARETAPSAPIPEPDIQQHEKNLRFLNIKRQQLESRHNILAAGIARERTLLREFDRELREPYI